MPGLHDVRHGLLGEIRRELGLSQGRADQKDSPVSMFSVLFPFIFLTALTARLSSGSRCLTEAERGQHEASPSLVQTLTGPLLGLRQTEVDPRRNKTVNWTSYFVSQSESQPVPV